MISWAPRLRTSKNPSTIRLIDTVQVVFQFQGQ